MPLAVPGASRRLSARPGVEQYSRVIQPASSTRSGGSAGMTTPSGSASRSVGSSEWEASSSTTPSIRRPPNGTDSTEPTFTPACSGPSR